jgi:hypothetical protein
MSGEHPTPVETLLVRDDRESTRYSPDRITWGTAIAPSSR